MHSDKCSFFVLVLLACKEALQAMAENLSQGRDIEAAQSFID